MIELNAIVCDTYQQRFKVIIENSLENGNYGYSECNLYYEALMNNIIAPVSKLENNLYNYTKELRMKLLQKGENGIHTFPGPKQNLDDMLTLINNLKLNNKILDTDLFKEFIGISEQYDFLFDIEGYTPNNFKYEWIENYGDALMESISKNDNVKNKIQEQIKADILKGKKIKEEILAKAFKYFF